MTYQQIACTEIVEPGFLIASPQASTVVVWVDSSARIQAGQIVTFKETGEIRWRVTDTYDTRIDGVNRGWGLDLPKSQRTER